MIRSRVGNVAASNTMLAPPNLVEVKSGLLPNIEAINAIIEQVNSNKTKFIEGGTSRARYARYAEENFEL